MNYHNITKVDMKNGEGLRVVLWVAGCNHHCKGCHNPITWDPNGGILFDQSARDEIYAELEKDYISGITFSGGDPFHPSNLPTIVQLILYIKKYYPNKTIWVYTGNEWEDIKNFHFMKYIDVLVDGEFIDELKDPKLEWVGSSNQRIIDVQTSLKENKVVLYNYKIV